MDADNAKEQRACEDAAAQMLMELLWLDNDKQRWRTLELVLESAVAPRFFERLARRRMSFPAERFSRTFAPVPPSEEGLWADIGNAEKTSAAGSC